MGDGFQTQTFPTSAGTTTRLAPMAVWISVRRLWEGDRLAYEVEWGDGEDETFERSVFGSAALSTQALCPLDGRLTSKHPASSWEAE